MKQFMIYPAIDIRNGKCVRLLQGDYAKETIYGESPLAMAQLFGNQGATWIHTVDLDGAKEGRPVNDSEVIDIAEQLQANVQVGGGIRTEADIVYYLEKGIKRIILGSAAINNPSFVKEMLKKYQQHIAIGIDAKDGYAAIEGWLETSTIKATVIGKELAEHGAETFIFTDIKTDGMLSGPNTNAVIEMAQATNKQVIASGGISALDDVKSLMQYKQIGVSGAIIGKALYTNQFTVSEAVSAVKDI
ncbi:1-(5-phosphoribosyl)-5-[(5-phosphoribosylamino)methylideneamino]imidazole-4-carboxamide isomerase [Cytobacillus sp. Hm23]